MLSNRQVEQEASPERDVGDSQLLSNFSGYESALPLEQQVTDRKESDPNSAAARALIKADALLPVAGLSEPSDFESRLGCCRWCKQGEK
jgi:hypothetical protein